MITLAAKLFFILNPIGSAPLLTKLLKDVEPKKRAGIIVTEVFGAMAILLGSYLFGKGFLNSLSIPRPAIYICGSLLLGKVAWNLNFPGKEDLSAMFGIKSGDRPFLIPIATPMLAGPGSMVTMIQMAEDKLNYPLSRVLGSLGILGFISSLILVTAPFLMKNLSKNVISIIERMIGMLLLLTSISMFLGAVDIVVQGYLNA